jgi:hypothetical protein
MSPSKAILERIGGLPVAEAINGLVDGLWQIAGLAGYFDWAQPTGCTGHPERHGGAEQILVLKVFVPVKLAIKYSLGRGDGWRSGANAGAIGAVCANIFNRLRCWNPCSHICIISGFKIVRSVSGPFLKESDFIFRTPLFLNSVKNM